MSVGLRLGLGVRRWTPALGPSLPHARRFVHCAFLHLVRRCVSGVPWSRLACFSPREWRTTLDFFFVVDAWDLGLPTALTVSLLDSVPQSGVLLDMLCL